MTAPASPRGLFVRSSASALLLRLIGAGLAFGLQVFLARLLGHGPYGVYILAFTTIFTLSLVLKLGFDTATVRFAPGYRTNEDWGLLRGLLRESSRQVWIASCAVALVIAAVAAWWWPGADPVLAWTFCIAAAALPFLAAQHLAEARLRALGRITLSRIPPELLQPLLLALLVVVFLWARGTVDATAAMACTVLASACTLLFSSVAFRRVVPGAVFESTPRSDSRVWRAASLQLTIYSTTMLVIGQIDVIVTGALLGAEAAGGYATASRISKFVPFGITAVNLALMPLVSRLYHAGEKDELQKTVISAAAIILAITLPLGAGAIAFGRPLLGLFGAEFGVAYGALVVLTIGRMVNALCGPTATLLTMMGNEREVAVVAVASAVLDGALLFLLVPAFGLVGAAAATTVTTIAWNLIQVHLVRRKTGIHPTLFALLRRQSSGPAG